MTEILILIDVQESFRHRDYWDEARSRPFVTAVNALISDCVERNVPIVRVYHLVDAADNAFNEASGYVRPLEGLLDYEPALVVKKRRHSALVGTNLLQWLRDSGYTDVMIAGIRTEQCCETTTRHLSDEGFKMTFVTDATLTFDMTRPDGEPLPADVVHRHTEAVLNQRFATIARVQDIISTAVPQI